MDTVKKVDLNEMYGRVSLLHKSLDEPLEDKNYAMMNALLQGLFSHAMNLMKNLLLDQTMSMGSALSAKKVLEYYALLEWLKKQSNPKAIYQRYQDWFAIKHYQTMLHYPEYDDVLFDLEALKDESDQANERYQAYLPNTYQTVLKSPLPFTLDETIDFERLIKEYLPNHRMRYLEDYRYLSLITVPHSYGDLKQEMALKSIYYKALMVVDILSKKAKNHPQLETFEQHVKFFVNNDSEEGLLYEQMHQQADVLKQLIKTFTKDSKRHVMGDFLAEISVLFEDVHSDYFIGHGGMMKRKWGLLVEQMSVFNLADNDRFKMMRYHTDYLKVLTFKPLSERKQELLEKAYEAYLQRYSSDRSLIEFEQLFKEPLGFLINEDDAVPSPSSLALALLKQQFKASKKDPKAQPQELLSIMYRQGRLFETVLSSHQSFNAISLREGQNIMFALDHFVMAMMYSLQRRYEYAQKNTPDNGFSIIIEALKKGLKTYFSLTNKKHQYFKNQIKDSPSSMVQ